MRITLSLTGGLLLGAIIFGSLADRALAGEVAATPTPRAVELAQADGPMVITPTPNSNAPQGIAPQSLPPGQMDNSNRYSRGTAPQGDQGGPGMPYAPGPNAEPYASSAQGDKGTYSLEEITAAGNNFFGKVTIGFARVIEYAFHRAGRPNGYILGNEAGGAFIAGLRYGEGVLYTKDAGNHRVYWQGPSLGYDFGAEGSKTMVLVYDLHSPGEIYNTFAGVEGSAYLIGGVGVTFLNRYDVTLAPIRSGVGLRLGANIGYLKYTREPTWNPF
jgi:hypothetical protein